MEKYGIEKHCNYRKCGIIGCGNVGSTTAYTLMQTGWFSEMVLVDLDTKRAEGEASDIAHGLPFHTPWIFTRATTPILPTAA